MANEYLKRTPTSTGNRKKWTWAGWVKLNKDFGSSDYNTVWSVAAGTNSNNSDRFHLYHYADGRWVTTGTSSFSSIFTGPGGSTAHSRDPGAWMHICLSVDTTTSSLTPDKIQRFWVNGIEYNYDDAGNIADNTDLAINGPYEHYIGTRNSSVQRSSDGQMFDLYLVDGQALTPDVFGFNKDGDGYISVGSTQATDFRPGQWSPHSPRKIKTEIERRGGFGVNGFYLPMNDSSNPGADFHCTPNSIIKLKGEDLPQPRNGAPDTTDAYVSQLRQETGSLGFDGCVKFDGSGDYLSIPSSSDFALGTGDWTIEYFAYPTSTTQYQRHFYLIGSNANNIEGIFANSNGISFGKTNVWAPTQVSHPLNRWNHYALVHDSTNMRLYINGNQVLTSTDNFANENKSLHIGYSNSTFGGYFTGFMSNFRVVKGTALYTSNFTAPTEPLTNVTNTKLLCCNSSTSATASTVTPGTITANGNASATRNELTGSIVLAIPGIAGGQGSGYGDYSADIKGSGSNKTITATGDVDISATASHYGSALNFPGGSTSSLATPSNSDFALGTGDFTVEFWVKASTQHSYHQIFDTRGTVGNSTTGFSIGYTSGNFYIYTNTFNIQRSVSLDQFVHIAAEREGSNLTLYINGVAVGIQNNFNLNLTNSIVYIGATGTGDTTQYFKGQVQDLRVYKGVAKYKGGFDVPKPYTPVGIEDFRTTADTCKNNFATLSPIDNNGGVLSNGNLTYGDNGSDGWNNSRATIGASSGKWYWEMRVDAINQVICASVAGQSGNDSTNGARLGFLPGQTDDAGVTYYDDGRLYHVDSQSGGQAGWGAAYGATDVIGIALDMDDSGGKVWFSKNGSWQASGNPSTGANAARSDLKTYADTYFPTSGTYFANTTQTFNFGQNLTFSDILGNKGNRLNSANNSWTLTHGGAQGNFTVADDGVTLSGTTATSAYMRATYTLDPKKKYIISLKYTAGANNQLAIQDDKGYITTTDGTSTTALQVGNHYAAVISASTSVVITATNWQTSYTINNIHLSEYDAGYTDDSGKGKFQYQPPTGFLALCEDNLPTPAIADPGDYFKTVLYTGTGSSRAVTGVGFKPDFVWIKNRDSAYQHQVYDSVRGAGQKLLPSTTNAEVTDTANVSSFDSNGFSFAGGNVGVNQDTKNHVAWCWKAGGAATANTDGSITSQVSVNQDAGFSIVTYTGNAISNATVGHGLDKEVKFMITKSRTTTDNWVVHTDATGTQTYSFLNTTDQLTTDSVAAPTSSVFYRGTANTINGNNLTYVSYCWAEIEGYSKFGSYVGNANADGPFVYCGFRPAWVMIKRTDGTNQWQIQDTSRNSTNPTNIALYAEANSVEEFATSTSKDFLSNGFKIRGVDAMVNASGGSYIFMAFAESPFQTANAK